VLRLEVLPTRLMDHDRKGVAVNKMDALRAEIRKANDYMAAGKKEEAKRVLETLFKNFPDNKNLYGDAVSIYLVGKMFDDAKAVFHLYKSKFGEDLRSDFSLADIDQEKTKYAAIVRSYDSAVVKVFKRMSAFDRGRLSNLPMVFPVKEIRLSLDEIVLRKGGREYHYPWTEILDAFITSREGHKGYLFSEDIIRTLYLRTKDRTFKIDVSANFPDFKDNEILLGELRKQIALREEKKS